MNEQEQTFCQAADNYDGLATQVILCCEMRWSIDTRLLLRDTVVGQDSSQSWDDSPANPIFLSLVLADDLILQLAKGRQKGCHGLGVLDK